MLNLIILPVGNLYKSLGLGKNDVFFGTQLYCKHSSYEGYFLAQKALAYIELKNFFPIKFRNSGRWEKLEKRRKECW